MLPCSPCTGFNLLQKTTFSSFLVIATVPALQPLLLLQKQFGNPWIRSESCCCYNEKKQTSAQDIQAFVPWARGPHMGCCSISSNRKQWQLHRKECSCTVNQRAKVQIQLQLSSFVPSPSQMLIWYDWKPTPFLQSHVISLFQMYLSLRDVPHLKNTGEVLSTCVLSDRKQKQTKNILHFTFWASIYLFPSINILYYDRTKIQILSFMQLYIVDVSEAIVTLILYFNSPKHYSTNGKTCLTV